MKIKMSARITNTYFWEKADQDGQEKIKGRYVAVGSMKRTYYGCEKSDGLSRTVIAGSIFLTGVIETYKNRAISTIEVVNTFI